jgi:hypothetical protein
MAQCVWWLPAIISLEQNLVVYIISQCSQEEACGSVRIDKEKAIIVIRVVSTICRKCTLDQYTSRDSAGERVPVVSGCKLEDFDLDHRNGVLMEWEDYLQDSQRLHDIATLRSSG